MLVMPSSRCSRRISICISSRNCASRLESGSSSSSSRGSGATARASATRCCWPPESWRGKPLGQRAEPHQVERAHDAACQFLAAHAAPSQAERDIVAHRQMREQRIGLEHQPEPPAVRRRAGHVDAVDAHRAGARRDQAGDHAQHRGLAAARRPQQRHELAGAHVEVEAGDHGLLAIAPAQPDELHAGHAARQRDHFALPAPRPVRQMFRDLGRVGIPQRLIGRHRTAPGQRPCRTA